MYVYNDLNGDFETYKNPNFILSLFIYYVFIYLFAVTLICFYILYILILLCFLF